MKPKKMERKAQRPQGAVKLHQTSLNPDNNILIITLIPKEIDQNMLKELFQQYDGFKEARLIGPRNVAFIEYQDIPQAVVAFHGNYQQFESKLKGLKDFPMTKEYKLNLNYAKTN